MEIVFQLITVATAIVATLVEKTRRQTKILLVLLALASGIASIVKSQQDATKQAFTASALESVLIALPNPSDTFSNGLMKSADDVARRHQLVPQQTVISNDNAIVSTFSKSGSQQIDAIAAFTGEEVKQIWVNYLLGLANAAPSSEKRSQLILSRIIDPLIESELFKNAPRRESEDEMNDFLNHLELACRLALHEKYGDPKANWHVEVNARDQWLKVSFEEDRAKQVQLDKTFIQPLVHQENPEAYAAAYRECKRQLEVATVNAGTKREGVELDLEHKLELDSLAVYLKARFPERRQPDLQSTKGLLSELATKKYASIKEVDNLVQRNWTWFLGRERSRPPQDHASPGQTVPHFSAVGVIRVILHERESNERPPARGQGL